jgi:cysteine desulfurase NifS
MKQIYLDYNATTPIDPEVARAMTPFLHGCFGNPSSSHSFGIQARAAVEKARSQAATLLECDPDEIIFTSGGSESNNLAIKGYALAHRDRGNHIITSRVEHPAVLEVCRYLEKSGFEVTYLPVDRCGRVDPADVRRSMRKSTLLVSIMQANNEVGTLQPVSEIARIAREGGVVVHTDSAQAAGKIPVGRVDLDVDLVSLAGHKFYAPKGVGILYVRRGIQLQKQIHGAGHERGLRAGTENVLEIVGLGQACEMACRGLDEGGSHLALMRDRLEQGILDRIPWAKVNGDRAMRLPNTLSISFPGLQASRILEELQTIACSAGAACHSGAVVLSHVLEAMGVPADEAMATIRLSTGRMTTEAEIEEAAQSIFDTVSRLAL